MTIKKLALGLAAAAAVLMSAFSVALFLHGRAAFDEGVRLSLIAWFATIVIGYLLGVSLLFVSTKIMRASHFELNANTVVFGVAMALLMWVARGEPATANLVERFVPEPGGLVISILLAGIISVAYESRFR